VEATKPGADLRLWLLEREVVDLYRAILMTARIGERFDATVVAITGGGIYVTLDHPFVDVLVRYDALGPDHYEASEDELSVVGLRSGDTLRLGDRIVVQIEDAAVLRRTVYARRVLPAGSLAKTQRRGVLVYRSCGAFRCQKPQASCHIPAPMRGPFMGRW